MQLAAYLPAGRSANTVIEEVNSVGASGRCRLARPGISGTTCKGLPSVGAGVDESRGGDACVPRRLPLVHLGHASDAEGWGRLRPPLSQDDIVIEGG